MKFTKSVLRTILIFFIVLFLFQSCKVYHTKSISSEIAIQSNLNVKVKLIDNEAYFFKYITKENNKIYGIFKSKTETTKDLNYEIIQEGRYVKIHLPENKIKSIHLKNKTASVIIPIGVGIAIIIGLREIVLNSISISPGWN